MFLKSLMDYLTEKGKEVSVKIKTEKDGRVTIITEKDGITKSKEAIVFSRDEVEKIEETKKELSDEKQLAF